MNNDNHTKRCCCLILVIFLLTGSFCACADPDLTLQDTSLHTGFWADEYSQILTDRSAGIRNYQDYVTGITSCPVCRAVGIMDLTGDSIPELLFWDLVHETEYGFDIGRLWIYTADGKNVHCALTIQPEIDDMLYSRYYLAENSLLTVYLSDTEMGWILQFRPDPNGYYAAETTLTEQADFSGEGPDSYFRNGKKISLKKFKSLTAQIQAGQGSLIGSLQVDEGGYGFTHTLTEALDVLSSEEYLSTQWPEAGMLSKQSPDPADGRFPELSFFPGTFREGQKFAVYSAPTTRSWRGADGKAAVTSGSEILTAGTEGDWILIFYELNSGVARVGYIDSRKINGQYASVGKLSFSRTPMILVSGTAMTDDPIRQKSTIGKLKKGTEVTCLARYQGWIYVEAKVSGKTARGFIAPSSLGLD